MDIQMLWKIDEEITNKLKPVCNELDKLDIELLKTKKMLSDKEFTPSLEIKSLLEEKLKLRGEKLREYISLLEDRNKNQKNLEKVVGIIF